VTEILQQHPPPWVAPEVSDSGADPATCRGARRPSPGWFSWWETIGHGFDGPSEAYEGYFLRSWSCAGPLAGGRCLPGRWPVRYRWWASGWPRSLARSSAWQREWRLSRAGLPVPWPVGACGSRESSAWAVAVVTARDGVLASQVVLPGRCANGHEWGPGRIICRGYRATVPRR